MLKVNKQLLISWLKEEKKNNPTVRLDLINAVRIAPSTLQGILYANKVPNPQIRLLIAQFTNLPEEKLFPKVEQKGAA